MCEVSEGVVLDYDADGNLVGIDIDHASQKLTAESKAAATAQRTDHESLTSFL